MASKNNNLPFQVGDIVSFRGEDIVIESIYRNQDGTLGGSYSHLLFPDDVPYFAFDDDFKEMKK